MLAHAVSTSAAPAAAATQRPASGTTMGSPWTVGAMPNLLRPGRPRDTEAADRRSGPSERHGGRRVSWCLRSGGWRACPRRPRRWPGREEKVKRLAGEPLARFRRPDSRCQAVSGGIPPDTGHNRRVVFSPCTPPTACGNAACAWAPWGVSVLSRERPANLICRRASADLDTLPVPGLTSGPGVFTPLLEAAVDPRYRWSEVWLLMAPVRISLGRAGLRPGFVHGQAHESGPILRVQCAFPP